MLDIFFHSPIDLQPHVVNRDDYIQAGQAVHVRDANLALYQDALRLAGEFNQRRLTNRNKVFWKIFNNLSEQSKMVIEADARYAIEANNPMNVNDPFNPFALVQIIKSTHYGNSANDMYAKRLVFQNKLLKMELPTGSNAGFSLYKKLSDLQKEETIFVNNNPLNIGVGQPAQIVMVNSDIDYTHQFMEKSATIYRDAYKEYLKMMQRNEPRFQTLEQAYKFASEYITDDDIPGVVGAKRRNEDINDIVDKRVNQTLKRIAAEKGRQRNKQETTKSVKPLEKGTRAARPCLCCLYKYQDKDISAECFKHFPQECPWKGIFAFKDIPKDFLDKHGYKPKDKRPKAETSSKKKSVLATVKEEAAHQSKKARLQDEDSD